MSQAPELPATGSRRRRWFFWRHASGVMVHLCGELVIPAVSVRLDWAALPRSVIGDRWPRRWSVARCAHVGEVLRAQGLCRPERVSGRPRLGGGRAAVVFEATSGG